MGNYFSVPIFFIVFRETIEAAIICSVLLSLVSNLVENDQQSSTESTMVASNAHCEADSGSRQKALIRRMQLQVWFGAAVGFLIALCIGGAFIAVFFTLANDIWAKSEEIWEGVFSLVACIIIFVMGLTMLRIDRSKLKWQKKLEGAFDKADAPLTDEKGNVVRRSNSGKWTLFVLPLITVLREGLEAVVFVGGVSLGQSAKSIPIAAITGLICGFIVGYIIYASGSRLNLSIFLVVSTNILFLLGAGLFSRSVGDFERYKFNKAVGADVAELGDGPGSYDVRGNVWHLPFGNPENTTESQGWGIFNSILGWSNNASYGTILSYVFYWLAVVVGLVYMKWSEGRLSILGVHSEAGRRREAKMLKASNTSQDTSYEGEEKSTFVDNDRPTLNKDSHKSESSDARTELEA